MGNEKVKLEDLKRIAMYHHKYGLEYFDFFIKKNKLYVKNDDSWEMELNGWLEMIMNVKDYVLNQKDLINIISYLLNEGKEYVK